MSKFMGYVQKMYDILTVTKMFTGSIMKPEYTIKMYKEMTKPKRKYLYDLMSKFLRHHKLENDVPLIIVELNVLAARENVDTSVLMLAYLEKGRLKRI
ncbi:hypothetical protein [Crassaminicella indica]|uniref:Uncharacterized protein n=1 Tax=Crassaminicella indica TaxID=2855394 RepID=A0ABX8RD10_9CLOT|nr:hypothetical protein [Crassaminicella indica]QXM06958.1 hypothetical protein KVH43_04360 [Crassaminicella indica]